MSDDAAHMCRSSLSLSLVLDEMGINTSTVKRRRQVFLFKENATHFFSRFIGRGASTYHFGSQTEGATSPGLNSDLDSLICYQNSNVVHDWADWQQGMINLLMLDENTTPGYCRLQVLRKDLPLPIVDLLNDHCTHDGSGRVLLKNTWLHKPVPGTTQERNGPAESRSSGPGFYDMDMVLAWKCRSWPDQAREFTRRQRRYGWPSRTLLKQATKDGVFIVPVGYKQSPTEPLEWKISTSLAERRLIFSLSIVHIKCYLVLKMLMKTFVEPRVRKCISSYHCKTAVLYCSEKTSSDDWRNDNLIQCVTKCLGMMHMWITDGFCPQYIIPGENLFAGKLCAANRGTLLQIFTYLVQDTYPAILRVCIDGVGGKLQAKLTPMPSVMPAIVSRPTAIMFGQFEYDKNYSVTGFSKSIFLRDLRSKSVGVIRYVYQKIRTLHEYHSQLDKYERESVDAFVKFLSCWLGALIASVSLSHTLQVPTVAMRYLRAGAAYDIAGMLKLASVFYCSNDLHKAKAILHRLERHFNRYKNEIQTVCSCYKHSDTMSLSFCSSMYTMRGRKARATLFANCLTFSPQEMHCIPPQLRAEFFRSVGVEIRTRNPLLDDWMGLAVVDCLPYLYYLQYMVYRQLDNNFLRGQPLRNLDSCIIKDMNFCHLETACNLLGQCMEMEQNPQAALACYRASLKIRPRNNAAKWHVATFCYKMFSRKIGTC